MTHLVLGKYSRTNLATKHIGGFWGFSCNWRLFWVANILLLFYYHSNKNQSLPHSLQIAVTNGVGSLWKGFMFKSVHLGGGGALLNLLIPMFKSLMGVTIE